MMRVLIAMIFAFLLFIGIGMGVFYFVNTGFTKKKTLLVDVLEVIDGRTLEVSSDNSRFRVILAGVGFPKGDEKALVDAEALVTDVAKGKRLYMVVHKEVEGLNYVELKSSNGDSLNELILKQGLARYESLGGGFIGEMVAAENEARIANLGIWDPRRDLFKHMTGEFNPDDEVLSDAPMIDAFDSEDERANSV